MAPKTKELRRINQFLKDLTSKIKSDKLHDEDEISVQQMMSILDENVEEEEDQPSKTQKQRGKLIKEAIKSLPKLKAMAVKRIENQSTASSDSEKGNGDKLMMRYFLPCSPLGCNVCGKVKLTLEDSQEHKKNNHETYIFPCDLASCGSIYESQHEKNRHMKKH